MRNIILAAALLPFAFLNAQTAKRMPDCRGHNTTVVCRHTYITRKDDGRPPAPPKQYQQTKLEGARRFNAATVNNTQFEVIYTLKDESINSKFFVTKQGAVAFTEDLAHNPDCINYQIRTIR